MKKFIYPLQSVLNLKEKLESQEKVLFQAAMEELRKEQEALAQLEQRKNGYEIIYPDGDAPSKIAQLLIPKRYYRSWVQSLSLLGDNGDEWNEKVHEMMQITEKMKQNICLLPWLHCGILIR